MNTDQLLSSWSPARLVFFLKLRNVEIPTGASRAELIELVKNKADVPIISVEVSPYILENLTHEQLLSYLEERNYAIIAKAKIRAVSSAAGAAEAVKEVLKFALKDYEENVAADPSKYNQIIPKILAREEGKSHLLFDPAAPFNFDQFDIIYKEINLDFILQNFGAEKSLKSASPTEKLEFVNKSLQFLIAGAA